MAGSSRAGWSPKAATVTTNFTVMGKPAMVHAKFRLPFAASPPVLATAAANAGIASSFLSQSKASIAAGKGFAKVAVSPGPRSSGGTPGIPANNSFAAA